MSGGDALHRDLVALLGEPAVPSGPLGIYDRDETEGRGVRGQADAVVLPGSAEEVAKVVEWCYRNGLEIVPRGGGSGFSGGAVPIEGGVVVGLERMRAVRSFDPELWRMEVEAGLRTSEIQRLARENGLLFPPDPGAAEQSQIGGNIATNAGGPHAFKYGVTRSWVTGVEAVAAPGRIIHSGGPVRKDVSGYDTTGLLVGSEGTLGIITAAWLRFVPAPESRYPVAAFYPDPAAGCAAILRVYEAGLVPAALEFLDEETFSVAGSGFPVSAPAGNGFLVIAEADGSEVEARHLRVELTEVLEEGAALLHAPERTSEINDLWKWRDGCSIAVTAQLGGKVSEDIVVPADRLEEAITGTLEIGRRHDLRTCSWGHAGDGNLHSTFMVSPEESGALDRARLAATELFSLALDLEGTVSGEHGIGIAKNSGLAAQMDRGEQGLHLDIKQALDPKGLFNPGKKMPLR
ncbi:MAG: FAD-binding protein [Actinomycetota bacterium]|nr:FAD-binding protein [Actinomycetota bacterium]